MVDQRVGSPMQPPGSRNLSGESADRNPFDEDDGNFKRVNSGKDTGWIVQSLEQVRVTVLEDLLIIKQLCVPAFPPIYKIFDKLNQNMEGMKIFMNCLHSQNSPIVYHTSLQSL